MLKSMSLKGHIKLLYSISDKKVFLISLSKDNVGEDQNILLRSSGV